jgi:cobalt-precorrin 5A hydrolase
MKLAVVAITRQGSELAGTAAMGLRAAGYEAHLLLTDDYAGSMESAVPLAGSLAELVGGLFEAYDGLVMIMALGIVMRVLAPHIRDKRTDPAVVVLDERGGFVISALSGHLGGANDLARELAGIIGAVPVITTATDVQGLGAVDVLARDYNMALEPFEAVRGVNAALVNGGRVGLYSEFPLPEMPRGFVLLEEMELQSGISLDWRVLITGRNLPPQGGRTLLLRPRNLVVGMGCRRGAGAGEILQAIRDSFKILDKSLLCIKALATVDLKAGEPGLKMAAVNLGVPLLAYDREDIKKIFDAGGTDLTFSPLVQQKIGVGGVCEPVALLACPRGRLIMNKTKYPGITVAVVEESSGWWEPARGRRNI